MSDRNDAARSADEPAESQVQELSDEELDAVSGGKEAAADQIAPGG